MHTSPEHQPQDGVFVSHGSGATGYVMAAMMDLFAAGSAIALIVFLLNGKTDRAVFGGIGVAMGISLAALGIAVARAHARRRLTVDEVNQRIILENFPDPAAFWPSPIPQQTVAFSEITDVWYTSQGPMLNIGISRNGRPAAHRIGDYMSDHLFLIALLKEIGPRGHQPRKKPRTRSWLDRPGANLKLFLLIIVLMIVSLIAAVAIGIYTA